MEARASGKVRTISAPWTHKIAVVIPCYRVRSHIIEVLSRVGPYAQSIYVVDDACPENTAEIVEAQCRDPRVQVIRHAKNQGVGGAVLTGYQQAIRDGAQVIVKIDGDNQMDPDLIPLMIRPILLGKADYTKGNRFFNIDDLKSMPGHRILGNAGLSFMTKIASGYWSLMDPTNGFTAIHTGVASKLLAENISKRYFFESDMLYHLSILRAVVQDVTMTAKYADEKSNLSAAQALVTFPISLASRLIKRVFYNYFLRDFNLGSISLIGALSMTSFGLIFGGIKWYASYATHLATPTGSIMIATLAMIIGFQSFLFFLQYDVTNSPKHPLQEHLEALNEAEKITGA